MTPKVLLCLDSDQQPSVFDSVVAIDAGADHLLRHGGVTPEQVEGLVHGTMFTRGPSELKHSAIFIGGSDVAAGEALLSAATNCFFGPMRVSVMLDSNGCNTTAAAAVIAASRHVTLGKNITAAVIGTGPVGQRAARMLASEGVEVRVISRKMQRAAQLVQRIADSNKAPRLQPRGQDEAPLGELIADSQILVAAGPAGVEVVSSEALAAAHALKVVIDLNAAPSVGVAGIDSLDKATVRHGRACYGAIGVGGAKMKIHKAALRRLFESNDAVLDAGELYALGKSLG